MTKRKDYLSGTAGFDFALTTSDLSKREVKRHLPQAAKRQIITEFYACSECKKRFFMEIGYKEGNKQVTRRPKRIICSDHQGL